MSEKKYPLSFSPHSENRAFWDHASGQINKSLLTSMLKVPGADHEETVKLIKGVMQSTLDVTKTAMENLQAMQEIAHYQPAENEPSIFDRVRFQPSTEWVMWRSSVGKTSIVKAYEEGVNIIQNLSDEMPRNPETLGEEPPVSFYHPEFAKAGIKRHVLSFAWVIYAKYSRNLDWYETQADGQILMDSQFKSV